MHGATKTIDFCYGHRLIGHKGKCRYLHGHNGRLEVDVERDALDEMGMVMDFGDIRDIVKGWVDANLDHKMILCRRDRVIPALAELGEPLYLIDENPTAENIARLVYEQAASQGLRLTEVRLWETPSSYATYRA
ncbi:MAG: 6-carboxytetrahydropterin synthase [SAR202 cluster bacterium]|nr:6-carboxytetrahydropterin synthase [SAR202 cluster bacterium]